MKIKQLGILSGVALATLGTSAAQAALVVVPTGLAPGAQYRLVFVTAGTRDAQSTEINDYNTFVTNEVTGSALATALTTAGFNLNTITWKAIGSTSAVAARDNTGTNPSSTGVPIYLIDGNRVANNNADLWDGSLQHPINRNNLGNGNLEQDVWTGSDVLGLGFVMFELGANNVFAGETGEYWISFKIMAPGTLNHMYAMSSVLTVPGNQPEPVTVPEPTSLLGYITLGGLMLGSAVRKARK